MKSDNISNNTNADYFKVVASDDKSEATILMYGVIGQRDWWTEDNSNDITDIAIVKQLNQLAATHDRINLRINSPGGSVFHGNAIVTAIQSCAAEVHVYNDGLCASMAAIIWAAAKKDQRHMAKNAVAMIHSPSGFAVGNAKVMRANADMLDIFEKTAIAVLADATGKSEEDIKAEYFDYTDHWMSYQEVLNTGLISKSDDEYEVEDLAVTASEQLTMMDIMSRFAAKGDEAARSFVAHMKDKSRQLLAITQKAATFSNNKITNTDMKKSELQEALKKGELTAEDVQEIMASMTPDATTDTPPAAPAAPAIDIAAEVAKQLEPLKATNANLLAENAKLAEKVAALCAQPGGNPSGVSSNGDTNPDDATQPDELEAFIAVTNKIAEQKGTVTFR